MTEPDTEMDEPDLCPIAVSVNGVERSLVVAADETLLDVLRDRHRHLYRDEPAARGESGKSLSPISKRT